MKKFYTLDLNNEEKKHMKASYGRIVKAHIDNLLLCNEIANIDESVYENAYNLYNEETDEYTEVYQTYLCNIPEYYKERLIDWGFVISYSDMLSLDVLMVTHFGTSWDYVLTDIDITTDINEVL